MVPMANCTFIGIRLLRFSDRIEGNYPQCELRIWASRVRWINPNRDWYFLRELQFSQDGGFEG